MSSIGKSKKKKRINLKEPERKLSSSFHLSSETKRNIGVIFLFLGALILFLSLINLAGSLGEFVKDILSKIFGWSKYLFPLILGVLGYIILRPERLRRRVSRWVGLILFILSVCGLFHLLFPLDQGLIIAEQGGGGGYLGFGLSYLFQKIMGKWASLIFILALFIVALLIMFDTSLKALVRGTKEVFEPGKEALKRVSEKVFPKKKKEEICISSTESPALEVEQTKLDLEIKELREPAKKLKPAKTWRPYPLTLLELRADRPSSGDIKTNVRKIQQTLQNFGIEVEMGEINVGPTVTQYTLRPKEGIRLSEITALHNDLALALAAHPIRIEAPIPGKPLVGIEVPNQTVALVRLREILETSAFSKRKSNLTLALGKDVAGIPVLTELDSMPHLLIAGATGSGKTICLHSIILTLLYQNSPKTLRFILIDPKRVELTVYRGLPHLLTPPVQDIDKMINALRWSVLEMERRFKLFHEAQARDIISYNQKAKERLPYIVIAVDELADLMVTAPNEVESCVVRLAQMARATGIHLILSTQRPSVNVITGLIKANITTRIAFACASSVDSRTIIDSSGAEKLLGNGDMLYVSPDTSKPRRIQGTYVSDSEIERVVKYLKEKIGEPKYIDKILERQKITQTMLEGIKDDELFEEAKKLVIQAGKGSASLLQRRLAIGYARAARLLDLLEERGIIGPADGSKPREVLVKKIENKEVLEGNEDKDTIQ